jgi:hypothetical protein
MRRLLIPTFALALLLAGCGDGDDDEGGFDGEIPEFADAEGGDVDDPAIDRGDVGDRPVDATSAVLAVDAEAIDVTEGSCVLSDVDVGGVFGFQAALAERDGSVSVTIDRGSLEAEMEVFLDGELLPTDAGTATFVEDAGTWEVLSSDEGTEGPRVRIVFGCPSEFEQRFGDDPGGGADVTPDPGQVD